MVKQELIANIARNTGISQKDVNSVIEEMIKQFGQALVNGDGVHIRNFGAFKCVHRKERKARNIGTGATVIVPAKDVLVFKQSPNFPE